MCMKAKGGSRIHTCTDNSHPSQNKSDTMRQEKEFGEQQREILIPLDLEEIIKFIRRKKI